MRAGAERAAQAAGRCDASRSQVAERLWNDHIQLDKCIASLDEDGLIEIPPGNAAAASNPLTR